MRFSFILLVLSVGYVFCKNPVKSLTDSLGQEIIEIGAPVKELPPGIDEEPAAEFDDDVKTTTVPPKLVKKATGIVTILYTTTKRVDDVKDDPLTSEEEESRVEKELAEIYKDNDYKISETTSTGTTSSRKQIPLAEVDEVKAVARAPKISFKFQPNVNNPVDVERFRTSIDEITCDKRVTQRLSQEVDKSDVSKLLPGKTIEIGLAILSYIMSQ